VLNALNDDPSTRSSLNPGTLIRVPVTVSGNPLAYTVHDGDSLPILSARLGLDQSSLDDLNPHIAGSGDLEAGTVIALPAFIPSVGDVDFSDSVSAQQKKRDLIASLASIILQDKKVGSIKAKLEPTRANLA
jgi:LysM repeat protein